MKSKPEKTNVMRILDREKIPYQVRTYPHGDSAVDGAEVARLLGEDPEKVYKTLVTQGASRQYYVFDIPVEAELDLKKAARAVGEKSVAMLHVKELLPLTGYVRGGCSPVGMKKAFPTTFHSGAEELDEIAVSAGRIGVQVVLSPKELARLVRGQFADIICD
ncbi:MAG: Cys-tRNA(Pro) deacylase [Clostridiales bacterium]|nr:Cys-tRNA(Pro) deacylase [Clostridiales bacterium]